MASRKTVRDRTPEPGVSSVQPMPSLPEVRTSDHRQRKTQKPGRGGGIHDAEGLLASQLVSPWVYFKLLGPARVLRQETGTRRHVSPHKAPFLTSTQAMQFYTTQLACSRRRDPGSWLGLSPLRHHLLICQYGHQTTSYSRGSPRGHAPLSKRMRILFLGDMWKGKGDQAGKAAQ